MADAADQKRIKRGRGFALLLALLYGVMTGGAFAPLPAQARPFAASILRDGQAGLALTAKSGTATLKAQRSTPDPVLLPEAAGIVRTATLRPASAPAPAVAAARSAPRDAPYQARAPPAL